MNEPLTIFMVPQFVKTALEEKAYQYNDLLDPDKMSQILSIEDMTLLYSLHYEQETLKKTIESCGIPSNTVWVPEDLFNIDKYQTLLDRVKQSDLFTTDPNILRELCCPESLAQCDTNNMVFCINPLYFDNGVLYVELVACQPKDRPSYIEKVVRFLTGNLGDKSVESLAFFRVYIESLNVR